MTAYSLLPAVQETVSQIKLVDTHEHLCSEAERVKNPRDFSDLFSHYASSDLVSAGLSTADLERVRDTSLPVAERWALCAPHWQHVRTTGYGRALLLAIRDLYGLPDLNADTVEELSAKMQAANQPGYHRRVITELSGIAVSIANTPLENIDPAFMVPVMDLNLFIALRSAQDVAAIAKETGCEIRALDDLLSAFDVRLDKWLAAGAVGFKLGVAYLRTLRFDDPPRAEAEAVFHTIMRSPEAVLSWAEAKPLQDFLLHCTVRKSIEHGLPIQVHTGLQEGTGNIIENSNPTHLSNLLLKYPKARFDLFHAGYPYVSEMATLGKNFENVCIDLCWVHIMSPLVARNALHEWLETVPANKIFAFGGDYIFVEGVYAHAKMAREGVARVLSEKVAEGYLTESEAVQVAEKTLRDNPARLYGLQRFVQS